MAAAKGMLPLANEELFEILVALNADQDEDIRVAAAASLDALDPKAFVAISADANTPAEVLAFLCLWPRAPREAVEAAVFNRATPDAALALLASRSADASIIEAISLKQQSLIRAPEIIEAILANPARTPEAERRALEVRQEFFEKRFGARMVAEEQRARAEAKTVASETISVGSIEDLIQLGLIEEGIDDAVVTEYENEFGPFETAEPAIDEVMDVEQVIGEVINDIEDETVRISPDRVPVFQQIALMSVKDRVMLGIKGTREARMILVRDPNRIVACSVLRNPRLTDTEVESVAAIRSVHEDVLRQIGMNRGWTRVYGVIHNLVRNPRTPIAISLSFLNRIQQRDMRALSMNKNVPDVIRQTAYRLYLKRSGTGG
ncbi:MAG TPA: hypothetical protein VNN73_14310 [Blastocatellia bacterium]|nr:hypothetical protein [Blastocatellia bacterium]